MLLFLVGMAILVIGYFSYGKLVEKILAPDDRDTPAKLKRDGVDFVPLPEWKNMLIQLLNIAGIGPVIGVILGVKFGEIVFIIIPIGNLIAGATHDFLSGMMSLRAGGANLPELVKQNLGHGVYRCFSVFMVFLLLLVVAVFINIPANLVNSMIPKVDGGIQNYFYYAVAAIFLYYIVATLFPVDKIIGNIYPFFGGLLILSTVAIFVALLIHGFETPLLLTETEAFQEHMWRDANHPVIPLLFVTIACGIISGFHATQSPIIARTMQSERQGRASFYGMMVVEGLIGMVWAGAGLVIYNMFPEDMAIATTKVLQHITTEFLGSWMGGATLIGVIVLAVTSGDTAMRSMRLSLAEILKIDQKSFAKRLLLCLPLIVLVMGLLFWSNMSAASFGKLWNYFAWGNQVLAAVTLLAATVWLMRQGKNGWIALLPGMFMTFIVSCYILWISPAHGGPIGVGLPLQIAYLVAGAFSLLCGCAAWMHGRLLGQKERLSC